ncbi:MAG: type I secretion system permease/ATPase [Chromatiales bacterium]|nr:type I secretion system permease/ATPase [Chromatiales bacterium]
MNHSVEPVYDPLLECLVLFARLYHRPISREALIAGLPIRPGNYSPELFSVESSKGLFSRVAKRAGFASRLVKCELPDISSLLLPCILTLRDRRACIIESIDTREGRAKIIVPEVGEGEEWVEIDALQKDYLGFAFLLKREYNTQRKTPDLIKLRQGHWFWGTLWRSRQIYGSVILASLMVNVFVLATPLFTMNVYDRVVPNNALDTLWVLAVGVGLVYLFDTVFRFIRTHLLEIAGRKSDVILSSILFEQSLNLRMEVQPPSVGIFANTLREFESIRNFLTAATLTALVDLPFAVIFLLVILYIGGGMVVIPVVIILLLLVYGYFMVKPLKESIESTYQAQATKHALLIENLTVIQTIKALGRHNHAQWEWEEASGDIARKSIRTNNISSSIGVVTNLFVQLATVALIISGVYMIKEQELSLGGLIAVMILASRAISPMGQVASLIASFEQTRTAFKSLDDLMGLDVERADDKNFVQRKTLDGKIEMRNLCFSYPNSEGDTLNGINLKIKQGERVGIIGKVGSGKSTIGKLLLNLYHPTEGSLLVDGIDIKQINPVDLRRNVAYVSQDVELLRGTVRENILYKDPQADDEQLLEAAHIGAIELFINRHPSGYDMPIGEQGAGLSGGQRQSVAIARAVLKRPPIVVLDEPTSSMDNTTESLIRRRLQSFVDGRTLILITHKTSMLDLVDRLIVLDEGRIVLDGAKAEVIGKLQSNDNAR